MSERRVTHWVNEAYAALSRGDIHNAAKAADRARDANRSDPRVQLLSGHLLIMCSAHEEGLTALERAEVGFRRAKRPVPGQLYCSRAVAFMKLFRHAEAAHWFRVALDMDSEQPEPYIGLGTTFMDRGDDEQAGIWFAEASRRFPASTAVKWGRAMYRLRHGDWPAAWRDYEMRLLAPDWLMRWGHTRQQAKPWDGQPIPGQSLVVFHEQGQGDTLMLTRYLPWLRDASQCARLCLLVPQEMMALVDTGIADWIGHQNPPQPIDYSLPFTSLPYFHQTRVDTVPPCIALAA